MNFDDIEQKDWDRQVFFCWNSQIQGFDKGRLENSACLGVKNIGKPCALIAHARFDEGGQAQACSLLYPALCTPILS